MYTSAAVSLREHGKQYDLEHFLSLWWERKILPGVREIVEYGRVENISLLPFSDIHGHA